MTSLDLFLEHHGIKGMKWGHRKARSVQRDRGRTAFARSPGSLSEAELKRRISRMEMEKKYNDLNRKDVSPGQKLASEILGNVGKSVVTATLTGAGLFLVKQAVEKKFGENAAKMVPKIKK